MSHLRDLVAALIDGELGHAERDRALAHLAGCATCRAEVAAHRAVKERLSALAAPPPPPGLLAELQRMAEPGEPLAAEPKPTHGVDRPPTVPVGRRPPARSPAPTRPVSKARRRVRRVLTGGAVAITTTLVTAFVVGGNTGSPAAPVNPDLDSLLVEHARSSHLQPFADTTGDVVEISTGKARP